MGFIIDSFKFVAPTYDLDLDAFRFYNDGTESGATAKAAENTNITLDVSGGNQIVLYRIRVQASGGGTSPGVTSMNWFGSYNGGSFVGLENVTGIDFTPGTQLTDGALVTQQLTPGSGSFQAGEQEESSHFFSAINPDSGNHAEHIVGFTVVAASVANADTIDLRMQTSGARDSETYSQVGRITISK